MTEAVDVAVADARDPLILAVDVGSSSARAIAYDASGRIVRGWEGHRPYEMETRPGGGVETDADTLVRLTAECIDEVMAKVRGAGGVISRVACDTFWHSLIGVDGAGKASTPVYTWADTRSADAARALQRRLDGDAVRRRTGAALHASYWPAKLEWLRGAQPDLYGKVARWMSIGEYLFLQIFGETAVTVSMASGTGLLDGRTCEWDDELLHALNLETGTLSRLVDLGDAVTGPRKEYASRWPELARVPWYPALGDGACNNVGTAGLGPDKVVVMVGTSGAIRITRESEWIETPKGLWTYRIDRRRIVQGGALSSGGNVFAWLTETLRLPSTDEVEQQVAAMQPDAHGLTVLPFLAGERSPHWNGDARGAVTGISLHTTPADQMRAWLEAVAYCFAGVFSLLEPQLPASRCIIGSGSGLIHSPAWMQIMSDAIEETLTASSVPEATSRGAALLVLESAGIIPDLRRVPVPLGKQFAPNPAYSAVYRAAMERQDGLYRRLLG